MDVLIGFILGTILGAGITILIFAAILGDK